MVGEALGGKPSGIAGAGDRGILGVDGTGTDRSVSLHHASGVASPLFLQSLETDRMPRPNRTEAYTPVPM